jgi:hypothetical protein
MQPSSQVSMKISDTNPAFLGGESEIGFFMLFGDSPALFELPLHFTCDRELSSRFAIALRDVTS